MVCCDALHFENTRCNLDKIFAFCCKSLHFFEDINMLLHDIHIMRQNLKSIIVPSEHASVDKSLQETDNEIENPRICHVTNP